MKRANRGGKLRERERQSSNMWQFDFNLAMEVLSGQCFGSCLSWMCALLLALSHALKIGARLKASPRRSTEKEPKTLCGCKANILAGPPSMPGLRSSFLAIKSIFASRKLFAQGLKRP